jgi:hypothetical protein
VQKFDDGDPGLIKSSKCSKACQEMGLSPNSGPHPMVDHFSLFTDRKMPLSKHRLSTKITSFDGEKCDHPLNLGYSKRIATNRMFPPRLNTTESAESFSPQIERKKRQLLLGEDSPAGTSKRQGFSEGSDR